MKYAVSVDIGGTHTRVALVDEVGRLLSKTSFTTNAEHPQQTVKEIKAVIDTFEQRCVGVGISCPGPLDLKNGVVLTPPNLKGWHYFPLQNTCETVFGLPVVIENDANLAGFAEAFLGAGQGHDVVQYLTISTGIGGGLVIGGEIFTGTHGHAQELANSIVWPNGPKLGSLEPGSIESISSGTAITKRAVDAGLEALHAGDVYQLSQQGNDIALQIMDDAKEYLANMIATLIAIIDPGVVVLGGGVSLKTPGFVEAVTERVSDKVYGIQVTNVNIKKAFLGDDNGIIGGGLYAFHKFMERE